MVLDNDIIPDDTGCELASSCLGCPFESCLQEEPGGAQRYRMAQRDALIAREVREGKGTYQIGRELGVSQRTVQRALRRSLSFPRKRESRP